MDFRRIFEVVFQPELSLIFSDDFRPVPTGKYRQLAGIHRKKCEKLPVGILLPLPKDFRCFPAGYGDFPVSFLQDPAGYDGRNLRPGWSSTINALGKVENVLK
jgi:hypothetical protein